MGDPLKVRAALGLRFQARVEVAGKEVPGEAPVEAINVVVRTVSITQAVPCSTCVSVSCSPS